MLFYNIKGLLTKELPKAAKNTPFVSEKRDARFTLVCISRRFKAEAPSHFHKRRSNKAVVARTGAALVDLDKILVGGLKLVAFHAGGTAH